MKKILVTGFDPFGGEKINPALEVIKLLPKKIGENEIKILEIPTVYSFKLWCNWKWNRFRIFK